MLKLICGPSGSGKTKAIVNAIQANVQNGVRCFLLVPEQQAYVSERDLAAALPSNAGLSFEVVSFSGLAEDVFREYGGSPVTSKMGGMRSILMWETLRRLSPVLLQYGKVTASDTSLTAKMLATVEELRNNGIDADHLENAANALPSASPLSKKLMDLAAVEASFRALSEECFGIEGGDRLQKAAELLSRNNYFENCNVYVDSFTSFTVPEYAILRELLKQTNSLTVTLESDRPLSRRIHFESLSETARRLMKLANEAGADVQTEILTLKEGQKPDELRILERDLWNFELKKNQRELPPSDFPQAIHPLVCSNLYEEAEACALNILGLAQNGTRFGEIAVVVRDPDVYRGVIDAAMERHGIPYFFSDRTELSAKPLSRLILSALRAVSRGYQTQDIITLVKTGLTGAEDRDVALFEEYCETWHISGKRFADEGWSMNPDGLTDQRSERANDILESANRVRRTVMEPLLLLSAELHASNKLCDRTRAIYDYLCRLNVAQTLSTLAKRELAMGERREAGETVRLYRFIVEILTSLTSILPNAEVTVDEFFSLLTLLFSQTDLGSVPNLHDCVVIGSAATLRVENIKASFLLGLCEGEFPKALADDGLLNESDKDTLEELGISLDSRQRIRSSEELFYVYRAMTKPSEQLFLSYPAMQTDGSARTPSLAYARVNFLFDRKPEIFDFERIFEKNAENTEKSEEKELWASPKTEATALHLSQSSVQTFVLCPYRYYATYLLELRSKKDSSVSAADEGTFLHFVFEQLLRSSLREDGSLSLPSPEALPQAADEIISAYLSRVCPIPLEEMDDRLLHLFSRLRGLALLMLADIVGEINAGEFRPTYFEQRIGGRNENDLPSVRLELQNGSVVELGGLVDRADVYEKDGKLYIRIVDYKSGRHEFSTDDVRSGLDIQLVLYLLAATARDGNKLIPAGAQYLYACTEQGKTKIARSGFLLSDDEIRSAADKTETACYTASLEFLDAPSIEELTLAMKETVCAVAEQILAGVAHKTPSERACKFCPVVDHCDKAQHPKN